MIQLMSCCDSLPPLHQGVLSENASSNTNNTIACSRFDEPSSRHRDRYPNFGGLVTNEITVNRMYIQKLTIGNSLQFSGAHQALMSSKPACIYMSSIEPLSCSPPPMADEYTQQSHKSITDIICTLNSLIQALQDVGILASDQAMQAKQHFKAIGRSQHGDSYPKHNPFQNGTSTCHANPTISKNDIRNFVNENTALDPQLKSDLQRLLSTQEQEDLSAHDFSKWYEENVYCCS